MPSCQIFSPGEIDSLRRGGKILRGCLDMLEQTVKEGMKTKDIDILAETYIRDHGGIPGFKGYNGYPCTLCISVNDETVHGMPGERVIEEGDIVSLDCGVILDGLNTDACVTVLIGDVSPEAERLVHVTTQALKNAIAIVKEGVRVGDISSTIQQTVELGGFQCLRALTGHGLGTALHQYPEVPNIGKKGTGPVLPANTIIAIEPIVSISTDDIMEAEDGWTLSTADGSLAAHMEHTVLITAKGCEVLA